MICPRKILAIFVVSALCIPSAAPQTPRQPPSRGQAPPQEEPQAKIRARAELVVVPVTVKDSTGNFVLDLRQEDFRILEDGVEQKIEVFANEPFPLSAVILIDDDLPSKAAEQVEQSLAAISGGFSENDETFVATFDQQFHPGKGFTKDNDRLMTELRRKQVDQASPQAPAGGPFTGGPRINGIPAPGTQPRNPATIAIAGQTTKSIDDAVYAAAQLLLDRDRERRKIIFLISDGTNSKNSTNKFDDVVKVLLSAGISVYAVGVGNAVFNRGLSVLSKYAKASGGDAFYAAKRDTLEDLYARVTEQARNQYTLAYAPRGTDRSRDYHGIEVRVRRPGLTLLTRDGYYTGASK